MDVFTRKNYRDIVVDSIDFCRKKKGLFVYGYVIMSKHFHLLVKAKESNLSDVIRDFKKFTSSTTLKTIKMSKKVGESGC
ncbi:MAG: transposase [Spirosomataceae bacterium]